MAISVVFVAFIGLVALAGCGRETSKPDGTSVIIGKWTSTDNKEDVPMEVEIFDDGTGIYRLAQVGISGSGRPISFNWKKSESTNSDSVNIVITSSELSAEAFTWTNSRNESGLTIKWFRQNGWSMVMYAKGEAKR